MSPRKSPALAPSVTAPPRPAPLRPERTAPEHEHEPLTPVLDPDDRVAGPTPSPEQADDTAPPARRGPRWSPGRPGGRTLLVVGGMLALGAVLAVLVGPVLVGEKDEPVTASLTEALAMVEAGTVTEALVDDRSRSLDLTVEDGAAVRAEFPAAYAGDLTATLLEAGVEVSAVPPREMSPTQQLLVRLGVVALVVAVLIGVVHGSRTRGVLGRRRKALAAGEVPQVTFADVAGVDEAVDQLREMVQFLREPERFEAVGATRPRGALLVGPPGTGKTLLARAVAGEAEVPFFALAGSDFVETYVGVGARRVRDLFAQARKAERAIIFIDEIDAVGRARSSNHTSNSDGERENTLISLLNEMDGFAGSHVIVLAATNRADTLDPALTRPGRLDRQVQVPNPDRRGRTLILQVHARSKPVADDVDLVQIARQTPGMSGADLSQVVNEACMEAARQGRTTVDAACFQAAVATVAMGRARTSALITDFDREVTAWHEAGHTLAAALLPDADDPVSVTIVPRGPAGGVTWMSGNDDVFLPRRKARAQLVVALAGRAAEERLLDGEHTQGASSDLHSATNLATAMVTRYGMTDFGYAHVDDETLRLGGAVAAEAHARVDTLLREAHTQATSLLEAHHPLLEAMAAALMVEETLSAGRVQQIIAEFEASPA
ncbi:ATP-dependent metallopeptidase FtsH/Yme1/Tma family protein [Cellulomonas bogoriensis]|uniref:ATP-dependent metallopeptidase FtsH/Yme1/Tma family protein n=1 Tax=Cellulomonas bogoriensis TaxID=301388 RepID=UPI0012EB7E41|nr:AAA family ATPase [Cellulomonas bogoriensis]